MKTHNPQKFLTPTEFWRVTGGILGRTAVYQALRQHRIRHIRVGSHYRIPATEVEDFFVRETAQKL